MRKRSENNFDFFDGHGQRLSLEASDTVLAGISRLQAKALSHYFKHGRWMRNPKTGEFFLPESDKMAKPCERLRNLVLQAEFKNAQGESCDQAVFLYPHNPADLAPNVRAMLTMRTQAGAKAEAMRQRLEAARKAALDGRATVDCKAIVLKLPTLDKKALRPD